MARKTHKVNLDLLINANKTVLQHPIISKHGAVIKPNDETNKLIFSFTKLNINKPISK